MKSRTPVLVEPEAMLDEFRALLWNRLPFCEWDHECTADDPLGWFFIRDGRGREVELDVYEAPRKHRVWCRQGGGQWDAFQERASVVTAIQLVDRLLRGTR